MEWISQNMALISLIAYLVVNIAAAIVAKTANTTDDKILAVVRDVLLRLSVLKLDANGKLTFGLPIASGNDGK